MVSYFGTCPHCGAGLEPDSLFCTACGNKLPAPTPSLGGGDSGDVVRKVASSGECCPSCGAPIGPGDSFCTSCSRRIIRCPRCSSPNESDSLFCTVCGTSLASPQPQPVCGYRQIHCLHGCGNICEDVCRIFSSSHLRAHDRDADNRLAQAENVFAFFHRSYLLPGRSLLSLRRN